MAEQAHRIGKVAKAVGLDPRTIRYYEQRGLLRVGRALSRYRLFHEMDITRLKLIKQLRKLGFSVSETKQVLPYLMDRLPKNQRTHQLKALLSRRLLIVGEHLQELTAIHQELEAKLRRLGGKPRQRKETCCEPFCGPETCGPGLVQITGLSKKNEGGGR